MSKEVWKAYKNTPYMVSNKGRVRRDDKILKERLNPAGYSYANLSYNGKSEQPAVHSMVLEAFKVPKPKGIEDPIVKHKNNKKDDNNLDNLEWGDISENTQEAYDEGLIEGKGADNSEKSDKAPPSEKPDVEDSYEETSVVPEGWHAKKPPMHGVDEQGAEERPVDNLPEGWQIKK